MDYKHLFISFLSHAKRKRRKKWNMCKKIFITMANEHNWVSLVATIALLHLAKALVKLFRKNTKNSIWIYLTNNAVINRKSGSYFVFDCLFMQCRSGTNAKEFTWDLNCLFRDVILLCCFFRFVLFFSFFLSSLTLLHNTVILWRYVKQSDAFRLIVLDKIAALTKCTIQAAVKIQNKRVAACATTAWETYSINNTN